MPSGLSDAIAAASKWLSKAHLDMPETSHGASRLNSVLPWVARLRSSFQTFGWEVGAREDLSSWTFNGRLITKGSSELPEFLQL